MKYGAIIIIISLLFSVVAKSQVPGYLGKKFTVAMGAEIAPVTGALVKDKPIYALQPKFMGSVQYVVGLDKEIGVFASYRSTTTEVPEVSGSSNMLPVYNDMWSAGASLRVYRHSATGEIAPLGNYRSYFVGYATSAIIDGGQLLGEGDTKVGSWDSYLVGIGSGKQVIIKDQFLIDYGIRFIYALQAYRFITKSVETGIHNVADEYSRFDEQAQKTLFSNFLFTVYAEFGGIF